jgi:hypothetical protein
MVDGRQMTVLSRQSPASQTSPAGLRYRVSGYVSTNVLERIETWSKIRSWAICTSGPYSDYRSTACGLTDGATPRRRHLASPSRAGESADIAAL